MKFYSLNLIGFAILLLVCTEGKTQSSSQRCGESNPRFCVGEVIRYAGKDQAILGVSQNLTTYIVKDSYGDDTTVAASALGKKSGRGNSNPSFKFGEIVRYAGADRAILGIKNNGQTYIVKDSYGDDSSVAPESLGKKAGRGQSNPSFHFDELVRYAGKEQRILAIRNNNYILKDSYGDDTLVAASNIGKMRNGNQNTLDSLSVYISNDTQDLFESITSLAKVTTKERSLFLKTLASNLQKSNSGDVNLFAGFLFAKIIRLSTAQVVRDHFEPPLAKYLAELEKSNWKSIQQIAGNEQTISFAIQVIAAGVRVRNTQAGVSPENEIRLKTLAAADAKRGMVAKAIALREFLMANMGMIEDLVSDPRHGAIGSLVADTAQWIHYQFREKDDEKK